MSVQSSKSFLKVFGIIDIILGALQVILGVVATAGGGLLASGQIPVEEVETEMPAAIIVVAGVVLLLLGIFSVVEGAVLAVPNLVLAITGGGSPISAIVCLSINVLLVLAANTLRKEGEQG